jgi:hypothetical protein
MKREAACSCGQLRATVEGEPVRISLCHCFACQRRTGSVFGAQARFPAESVRIEGQHREYVRHADEDGEERRFAFCSECGSTVFYALESAPGFHRRPGRRVRGSVVPAADGVRVRVAPAPLGADARWHRPGRRLGAAARSAPLRCPAAEGTQAQRRFAAFPASYRERPAPDRHASPDRSSGRRWRGSLRCPRRTVRSG